MTHSRFAALRIVATIGAVVTLVFLNAGSPRAGGAPQGPQNLSDRLAAQGRVRVIVEVSLPARFSPEGLLRSATDVMRQREAVGAAANRIVARLQGTDHRVVRRYSVSPHIVLEVGPAALAALTSDRDVARIVPDEIVRPVLAESVPLIQGDQVWAVGYDGTGQTIAVLDSGVDSTHPFLAGKVVEEACYSSNVNGLSESFCPNGQEVQIGPGSAVPCPLDDCIHGTHVAGIAAGNGVAAGQPFSGVASGAQLMAVQVFSKIIDPESCGGLAPCVGGFASDIIAGLERVYTIAAQRPIASANMSFGGGLFDTPCDSQPYKPMIDNLRAIGVAPVVASGNDASTNSMGTPACVSSAVSVGSTTDDDDVSWFSDVAPFLSLFAPGESIMSSVPGGAFEELSGTSMAAPHVAGAWAAIKQAVPGASVTTILNTLRQTGLPVTDTRFFGGATVPRIRIFQALAQLTPVTNPAPAITSLAPDRGRFGSPVTFTVNGSGFDAFSVVQWNGVAKPTTVVSVKALQATIPASDLPPVGTIVNVSVSTPAPGGGTSSSLPFAIDPPPTLTPNALAVAPGSAITVTLANGFGGATDWIALAKVGDADTTYVQYTYVGGGVVTRDWTLTMPTSGGPFEFRLFRDNGYTRAATSAPVSLDASLNPQPVASSMTPTAAPVGGAAFTLTVNGSGFVASSVLRWNGSNRPTTFVSSTQLRAAIGASDLAVVGTVPIAVFTPAPGGGTSAALSFAVTPPPTLSVSATNVVGGTNVTVTLTNGLGGVFDWLALAATSAPDTSYLQSTYVGGGVTTKTWTVAMPVAGGTFEFRLFLNNGYSRAATSPTVTVQPGPAVLTSLSPSAAVVGGAPFTLLVNGSGFTASSVVRWNGADRSTTFVSGTQLRAAIGSTDIASLGTFPVSVFTPAPGGGTSNSLPFTVAPPPSISVSATNVAGGASVTATLTNGLGGSTDWLALAATSAPNSSSVQWIYVGAGVTTRTWTVTMPGGGGPYEFRLFLNNGYTRAATSPAITVQPGAPTVTSLAPSRAVAGGAAFTLTVNGSAFAASSVVRWNGLNRPTTFVSDTQLQSAIAASDIAAVGTVPVSVFTPAPGGGTSGNLTFTIGPPPALSVSATSVSPGSTVTVTLTNGLGGSADWLALAVVGSANTSYLQWTYVGAGVTTRTWSVTMPATAGSYEFRLFLNNSYTRAATSPTVVVTP